jgi:hypothetical protein
LDSKIEIEYTYYSDYNQATLEYDELENVYYIKNYYLNNYNGYSSKLVSLILDDLKNKELYNYSDLFETK